MLPIISCISTDKKDYINFKGLISIINLNKKYGQLEFNIFEQHIINPKK